MSPLSISATASASASVYNGVTVLALQVALTVFIVVQVASAAAATAVTVDDVAPSEAVSNGTVSRQSAQQRPLQLQLQQLGHQNFLVGIAAVGAHYDNGSSTCGKELELLLQAAADKQLWSLKVLDSFGHAPRTFSWGNYFWFAARELCEELNTPYSISFSRQHMYGFNVSSPMPLRFTTVYLNFSTPHYIDLKLPFEYVIHLGLCLPASCATTAIMHYTQAYFESDIFDFQRDFELQLRPVEVRTPQFNCSFFKQTGSILFICILLAVILFIISAALIQKSRKNFELQQHLHIKVTPQQQQQQQLVEVSTPSCATFEELVLCFHLPVNCRRAWKLQRCNFLSVISGLRTIICLWVTVFHVYYYSLYAMTNAPLIFAKLEQFALQPIMQACFYVDVFFVISAFLLVYNFLSNESQLKRIRHNNFVANSKMFGKAVLHRYLRLTPVMLITMLLSDMVYDFLNMYTPFRLGEHSGIYCKRNWWYNLLYIHNFLDMKDICCSWTWYLGCEMQYFVLFTALLFVLAKNPKVAQIAFAALTLGFVVTGWLCNYRNGITFQIDMIHSTLNQLYVKPWVRINPYIGGAALGWLLQHYQQQRQERAVDGGGAATAQAVAGGMHSHAVWRAAFWLFCAALYVTTNFMSYWRSTPSWLVAAIMSFGKLLFALCVGGVIVLCARGRGGVLNALLSARVFLFLDKFCFSVYMVAPVIVVAVFGLRNEATTFTEVSSGSDFLAVIALSIAAAFLLLVLIELPMQRISNAFVRQDTMRSRTQCKRVASGEP